MKKGVGTLLFLFFVSGCGGAGVALTGDETPRPDAGAAGGETALACRARGFNYACWYAGCYQEEGIQASLAAAKELGANWLEVVPTWYQDAIDSGEIYEHPDKSPTIQDLRFVIPLAREDGFQIALKPHLDIIGGGWRGEIKPNDLSEWQESYEDFILSFASLAQELGVEVLSIGTELKTRSGDASFWRQLIPKIRGRYTGFLTYSANWDEYDEVAFWDLLDFIGIDFYFPLTDDPDAGGEEMGEALQGIRIGLKGFSETQGRPFLFTEIGYRSVDGTNTKPYDYQQTGATDEPEQADAYAAVLTVFGEDDSWLEGIFWWRLDPILGKDGDDYSPYGKLAGEVLQTFWGGATCIED